MMQTTIALTAESGLTASACAALGLSRASVYRARTRLLRPPPARSARLAPPRALGPEERSRVLDVLRTPRFVDLAPTEIYATYWTRASIFARSAPCIASWPTRAR